MNYQKLNRFWQSFTLLAAPIILTLLIYYRQNFSLYSWLLWLHLPFTMIHEAEEYVFSPLSYKEFFNLKTPMGSGNNPDYPLDESYVFQVNIMLVWPIITAGAILADIAPWLGFSMIWLQIILNNLTHTMLFQGKKPTYNPGLITNCILLAPLCIITIITAAGFFKWQDWALSVLVGVGASAALFAKTMSRRKKTGASA